MPGRERNVPKNGIRRRKFTTTGKNPLQFQKKKNES